MKEYSSTKLTLEPFDNSRISALCGQLDSNLEVIGKFYNTDISYRGNVFLIKGNSNLQVQKTKHALETLYSQTKSQSYLSHNNIHLVLQEDLDENIENTQSTHTTVKTKRKLVKSRTDNQSSYMDNIKKFDINFAIGPAGTGKTYLAVACAIEALELGLVKRVIFIRPAVEAGEKLGFLPGDMAEKVNPYLRPLYDALYDILGYDLVEKLIHKNIIEIAPLAFMRGRTLNDAFIILDEAQNTTIEQMKMFLTRMGFDSKMAITGDITQIDLQSGIKSGLIHAREILHHTKGIKFNYFRPQDIVRHKLVKEIINAYDNQVS